MADKKRIVDEDIAALFTTRGMSYGLEPSVAESEAIKRIKRNLMTLDGQTQKAKELSLDEYRRFKSLPKEERDQILRYAKERAVPVPQAAHEYFSDAARN